MWTSYYLLWKCDFTLCESVIVHLCIFVYIVEGLFYKADLLLSTIVKILLIMLIMHNADRLLSNVSLSVTSCIAQEALDISLQLFFWVALVLRNSRWGSLGVYFFIFICLFGFLVYTCCPCIYIGVAPAELFSRQLTSNFSWPVRHTVPNKLIKGAEGPEEETATGSNGISLF